MKAEKETMIEVNQVAMRFRMANDKIQSLKEYAIAIAKRQLKYKDFWVFKNVEFDVKKGEVVGIIGRNGAGKSTLLKIIAGVLTPTEGTVELHGNVVPMLELGSGFDVELSGRENIFLNGSVLGYSEEFIKEKYNEILEFSGLEEFIEVPIRNYSSGMLMRLAFSIATIVRPEILIVDEILAVGDEAFQKKSKRKMLELMGGGTTVLFVSHSIDQIREMCNRVVWLEKGEVRMIGDTKKVCDAYQEYINPDKGQQNLFQAHRTQEAEKYFMDILFIYGDMEEDYYWRVAHQKEQLLAGNMSSSEVYQEDITDSLIKKYRMFFLVGCEKSEKLEQFIIKAKAFNKIVLVSEKMNAVRKEQIIPFYEQQEVLCDRQEQLAEWAVYDREILPYIDQKKLSDQELINCHKAIMELEKHKEDGVRIGCFLFGKVQEEKLENYLLKLLSMKTDVTFFVENTFVFSSIEQKYPDRIRRIELKDREEIERFYSTLDFILVYGKSEEDSAKAWRIWLQGGIVKIPVIVCEEGRSFYQYPEKISYSWLEWTEKIELLLCDGEKRKQEGQKNYQCIKEKYTALKTGKAFVERIKNKITENVVLHLTNMIMDSEKLFLIQYLYEQKKKGKDVLILNYQSEAENIFFCGEEIPVLSKGITYIYGSMDSVIADGVDTYYFLQSYPNIKKKYFWLQGKIEERFQVGDFNRFRAMQIYCPCVPIQYVTSSKKSQQWLKETGIEAEVLELESIKMIEKSEQKNKKVKILIEGNLYYKDLELDAVFCALEKLEREKIEIFYIAAGAVEKEWYRVDRRIESQNPEEIMEIYKQCDILLQGIEETRYQTAVQLMRNCGKSSVLNRYELSKLVEEKYHNGGS